VSGNTNNGIDHLPLPILILIVFWNLTRTYCFLRAGIHVHTEPPPYFAALYSNQDISPGFVLCDPSSPCYMGQEFEAQIVILEHKSIICAGYSAVLHIHSVVEEVQITVILPSSSCPSPPPPVSLALPSSFPPHTSFSSSSTLPSPEQYCICCIIYLYSN